jgi:hypothetical protein
VGFLYVLMVRAHKGGSETLATSSHFLYLQPLREVSSFVPPNTPSTAPKEA